MKRLTREPLYQQAYIAIRNAILEGRYAPGERLVESELAERLGISRSPVREGVRQLSRDGLVTVTAAGEVRVTKLTRRDVEELVACRALLEQEVARLAALNASEAQIEEMSRIVAAAKDLHNEDPGEQLRVHERFHDAMSEAAGNTHLNRLVKQTRRQLLLIRLSTLYRSSEIMKITEEHESVLRAIQRRDPEEAKAAMERHMRSDRERFLKAFDEEAKEESQRDRGREPA